MEGGFSTSVSRRLGLAVIALAAALAATGLIAVDNARGSTVLPAGRATAPQPPASTPAPTASISAFPPTAPAALAVTSIRPTSITFRWTASTPGCCTIAGYDMFIGRAFYDVISIQNVGNVTTATITSGIQPTTQYTFWLSARDVAGHRSASSNAVTVVTPASDTGPDSTPPTAPTSLTVTDVTSRTAVLKWSPSTDNVGVTGYDVYRFDGVFVSTLVATAAGTTYQVPLSSSSRNLYYVRARDAAGNLSIASNLVGANPVTPPTTPSVSPLGCRVEYTTTSRWTRGFVAELTVANTGTSPVTGWRLTFTFGGDQRIVSAWHASFSQSGTGVTMRNANWNGTLPAGGSTTIGMQGAWTGSDTPPTGFSLNGVPCSLG